MQDPIPYQARLLETLWLEKLSFGTNAASGIFTPFEGGERRYILRNRMQTNENRLDRRYERNRRFRKQVDFGKNGIEVRRSSTPRD